MSPKTKVLILVVVVLVCFAVSNYGIWKNQRYDYVYNYMYSFTTPEMRQRLAIGHEALLADLGMIRGIQFYGKNFTQLDKMPAQYDQFMSLADAIFGLDPRHEEGYLFWGFGLTSSERGRPDSYRLLMAGHDRMAATNEHFLEPMPSRWKLAKEAGFVATYELQGATPEWGCTAYRVATESPECPEHIFRLGLMACRQIDPNPVPALQELLHSAATTPNEALRDLNIDHMRRIVAGEHKVFWDAAQAAYVDIHGASPTRIEQLTTDPQIMRAADKAYRERSLAWFDKEQTQGFPNLVLPTREGAIMPSIQIADGPTLPIDPFGGEYIIVEIDGTPQLFGTGIAHIERQVMLEEIHNALEHYRDNNYGKCPDDFNRFREETGYRGLEQDSLGYPLLLDRENCRFYFPPIDPDNPPTLPSYNSPGV